MPTRDDRKAERLIRILRRLSPVRGVRAAALGEELGVSRRTIFRDILALSGIGVPTCLDRDGYRLLSLVTMPSLSLSLDEALALRLVAQAAPSGPLGPFAGPLRSALEKVRCALIPKEEGSARMDGRVGILAQVEPVEHVGRLFGRIERAVYKEWGLSAAYRSLEGGPAVERSLDPYALFFRRRAWYLVAYCHKDRRPEIFRVSRFERVVLEKRRFERPPDFSLEQFLADAWELFVGEEVVEVVVRFAPRVAPLVRERAPRPGCRVEEGPDGSAIYRAKVAGTREIGFWILSFGAEAEVLSPPELREDLRRTAEAMVRLYGPGP